MAKKYDKAANAAMGKAASMRGENKQILDKYKNWQQRGSDAEDYVYGGLSKTLNKVNDRSRTIGRLESRADRSKASATYRLAKMKAEKKAAKGSKTGRMLDRMEMRDAPRTPFLKKNKKKDKK